MSILFAVFIRLKILQPEKIYSYFTFMLKNVFTVKIIVTCSIGNILDSKKDPQILCLIFNKLVDLIWREAIRIIIKHLALELVKILNNTK